MIKKRQYFLKVIGSILLVFLFSCSSIVSTESNEEIQSTEDINFHLLKDQVEIYVGQNFDPYQFVDESLKYKLSIANSVDINIPGSYVVIYSIDDVKKTLNVIVLEEPILLSSSELTLEFGSVFDPRNYINDNPKINIINPVNTSAAGTYTVTYSIDDFSKTLTVIVSEASINNGSDWLLDKIKTLDLLNHRLIEVDKCDLSGGRDVNVVVDVGYGDREYWAFTNEYGQLIVILADKITRQNERTEVLLGEGRYCSDEARVPGTESPDLDQGHVIADSLGGVSNAYNITPQDSTLNRYGDQAYMESSIRSALGASQFIALITYPNTATQTPSHYSFSYVINGITTTDDFDNVSPKDNSNAQDSHDISSIDTNHNGTITIAEAKAAGYSMPIHSDFWLYQYMVDGDNDGMVGE